MPPWLRKLGLTPTKAALIAVLGVVMIGVWGPQIYKALSNRKPVVASRKTLTPRPATTTPSRANSPDLVGLESAVLPARTVAPAATTIEATRREAPELTLADALVYDPFLTPEWSPDYRPISADEEQAAEPAVVESALAALLEQGVGMVLLGDGETAATIGERTVRVGDEIDGFRVVEISDNGVVLTPAKGGGRGA